MVSAALLAALLLPGGASAAPKALADLERAKERVPRAEWKGHTFSEMSAVLTGSLRRSGHRVKHCAEWSVEDLRELQLRLHDEADPEFLAVYDANRDNRRQRFQTAEDWKAHWAELDAVAAEAPEDLREMRRDGLCHEVVMKWAHHLPLQTQHRLRDAGVEIPSLPERRHETAESPFHSNAGRRLMEEYKQQVSCQQCHSGVITDPEWQDASVMEPLPVDPEQPGLERLRSCNFMNQPPCGPCEGLGGPRTGDGVHEFTPITCTVISGPETPATTYGRFPAMGSTRLSGDSRGAVSANPHDLGKGTYRTISPGFSFTTGSDDQYMRLRYASDFGGMTSVQSFREARFGETGATVLRRGDTCTCDRSIAGNIHEKSFDPSDPLDPLHLKPEEGGAAYLGRVQVTLDGAPGDGNRTVIADHFMNWAFHFLVDADESSESLGLPVYLYAPWGVRYIYEKWSLEDPTIANPNIWKMPVGCLVNHPSCANFDDIEEEKKTSKEDELIV